MSQRPDTCRHTDLRDINKPPAPAPLTLFSHWGERVHRQTLALMYRSACSLPRLPHKHTAASYGEEQMARPRSPPAGRLSYLTSLPPPALLRRGRLSRFFPPLAVQPYFTANKTGLLTVTYCPGTITNAINKRNECAMSSANTDTLCISAECAKSFHLWPV